MTLSNVECNIAKMAIERILKRGESKEHRAFGVDSVLVQIDSIHHKNPDLTPYLRNQIVNAITKPLTIMFFMSHSWTEKDIVEKLVEFIDINAGKDLSIWYNT